MEDKMLITEGTGGGKVLLGGFNQKCLDIVK